MIKLQKNIVFMHVNFVTSFNDYNHQPINFINAVNVVELYVKHVYRMLLTICLMIKFVLEQNMF